jgi:novel protein kinase C epsilon type
MLGGGQSYQIPEVLLGVPYEKSVDLYLFGLLAYELMVGKVAFSAHEDLDTTIEKIKNSDYEKAIFLTSEARDMIQKLVVPNPKMRLSIKDLRKHPFFAKIDWKQAEEGKLKVPPPVKRPINKSVLPMAYDSEDEEDEERENNSKGDNEDRYEDQQFSNVGGGEEYHYDEGEGNWVPKTL